MHPLTLTHAETLALSSWSLLSISVFAVWRSRAFLMGSRVNVGGRRPGVLGGVDMGAFWAAVWGWLASRFKAAEGKEASQQDLGKEWKDFGMEMRAMRAAIDREAAADRAAARKVEEEINAALLRCHASELAGKRRINKLETELDEVKAVMAARDAADAARAAEMSAMLAEMASLKARLDKHDSDERPRVPPA